MQPIKLFLCGDVMTGRGIDQILRHSCDPRIYEGYLKNAIDYVRLAERASGPIPSAVDDAYIWGHALAELERARPEASIINLETAVTRSGEAGLHETLDTLHSAGLRTAGAGANRDEAQAPAELPGGIFVYALGIRDSGIPPSWEATATRPGVDFVADLSERSARELAERIRAAKRPGDLVVVSIHWGGNWGYRVPAEQAAFAHQLIDLAAADLVHGHSSHHPKAAEIYRGKLILYGCGDFINDYEGISGHDEFRGDLGVMYFPRLAGSGELLDLELAGLCRRRLRLERAPQIDGQWLCGVLNAEGRRFGTSFDPRPRSRFALRIAGS